MAVVMTSEALGKKPGETFTGAAAEEAWLLAEGYAKKANYGDDTGAKVTGGSNAVNIVTGGNLVLATLNKKFTIALATSDTPAQAATKIDTALAGYADAAIVSSKLEVTTNKVGSSAYLRVVSGTGTVLANLGLTAGQRAAGGDGGVGTSNTGPAKGTPAQDLTKAANREPSPQLSAVGDTGLPDPGPLDPAMTFTTTDDDPNDKLDPDFDFDPAGVNNEAPTVDSISPVSGIAAGGTAVTIKGQNFDDSTGATVGGVALTSFVVVDDETITGVTGAHSAASGLSVAVTNPVGTGTKASAFAYTGS